MTDVKLKQWGMEEPHFVGLSRVKLVQRACYGAVTGVNHEFTHLPNTHWGVQVHVVHATAHHVIPFMGQFVDDKPAMERERNELLRK